VQALRNQELVVEFIRGATEGINHSRTLGIYGDELVHYETVIARRVSNGIMVSERYYSPTTNRITQCIRLEYIGVIYWVPHVRLNDSEYRKLDYGAKLDYDPNKGVDPIFRL
jgi:hypothetical protein